MINDVKKNMKYDPKNEAKTIGQVKRDRPFFPGDASLAQIMPDMKQTKDKEYLAMSNVSLDPNENALLTLINAGSRVLLQVSNASVHLYVSY